MTQDGYCKEKKSSELVMITFEYIFLLSDFSNAFINFQCNAILHYRH